MTEQAQTLNLLNGKIYHLADIHIRTLKRHREYTTVFNRTVEHIRKTKTENDVIVVAGDIVHSKLDMSPELVSLTSKFFKMLADELPTIVITGNHDTNLNNSHRLDALEPIIDTLNHPNLYYWKKSGVYELGGVHFAVLSVFDDPETFIKASDFEADFKIALHHGPVSNSWTDTGIQLSNDKVTVQRFDGYDLTLLGDIHKRQFLNSSATIAYPGSLIQQNHGETLDGHGMLIWTVKDKKSKFVEIENDYGYVTFEVEGATIVSTPERVPKNPRIRLKVNDTSASDIKMILSELKSQYNVRDIAIQRNNARTSSTNGIVAIEDVRDVEVQNKYILDYLRGNGYVLDNKMELLIQHLNRQVNVKLDTLDITRHLIWNPLRFEFSNMFSYGPDNVVDFTKVEGMNGLFAPNTSGKSSLLDAITYTIFDKCSKTSRPIDVLNNKSTKFECRLIFEMGDRVYTIQRKARKTTEDGKHVRVDVDFWYEDETGTHSLNGEDRNATNKIIRKYMGTFDDFVLTAFSLQGDSNNFIEKSQRERKNLLSQFLDIQIFEELYNIASSEIKETQGKIRHLKKTDFESVISKNRQQMKEKKKRLVEVQDLENMLKRKLVDVQERLINAITSKRQLKYQGPGIKTLETKYRQLDEKVSDLTNNIETLENTIVNIKRKRRPWLDQMDEIDYEVVKTKCDELQRLTERATELRVQIDKLEHTIEGKKTKVQHLKNHEYDPECKYCVANVFVQDALKAKEQLEDDLNQLNSLENELIELNSEISALTEYNDAMIRYNHAKMNADGLSAEIDNKQYELQAKNSELNSAESDLATVADQIDLYNEDKSNVEHNEQVEQLISTLNEEKSGYDSKLSKVHEEITNLQSDISVLKSQIDRAKSDIGELKQLEQEYKGYEMYLKAVKRDGVPYDIITLAIPKIENEINNILEQIVSFNMVLETDGKNINGYIIYDEDDMWPLELTSGMERFISSLAIRVALINVSALPRPNFIAIDEGFGSLDSYHMSQLSLLFEYLKTQFSFTIIVSHLESMRDMVDKLIEISKTDGYSRIEHV